MNDRTIELWNLQLQLFELTPYQLSVMARHVLPVEGNAFQTKARDKAFYYLLISQQITEEERLCLATTIAVYLSGAEE